MVIPHGASTPSKYTYKRFQNKNGTKDLEIGIDHSPHLELRSKLIKELKSVKRKTSEETLLPKVDSSQVTLKKVIREMIQKNKM